MLYLFALLDCNVYVELMIYSLCHVRMEDLLSVQLMRLSPHQMIVWSILFMLSGVQS